MEKKKYTLYEIIKNNSKKDLVVELKDGHIVSGRIQGYETEIDSEVGDDVIFLGKEYANFFYEIKVSDIVDIKIN